MNDQHETEPRFLAAIIWCASFGSILILLTHLRGLSRMDVGGRWVLVPSIVLIAAASIRIVYRRHVDLQSRLMSGLFGGLWGTLGYDLFRIPFHYAGMNVFAPIYAYGMWLAGADHSSVATDALGFAYHLSNGIAFGWIYSLLFSRRHWGWAVVWALLLETLAVVTVFGSVFSLRTYSGVLFIAYVAHLFYGIPLGVVCQKGWNCSWWTIPPRARVTLTIVVACCTGVWFVNASHPFASRIEVDDGEIVIDKHDLHPGWTDQAAPARLIIHNETSFPCQIRWRSDRTSKQNRKLLPPHTRTPLALTTPGIHQIGIVEPTGYRSIFVSVHRDGNYRPDSPQ